MPRRVIVKPLEQIDVTRMILGARKHVYEKERALNQTSFGLGNYRRIASLEPRTGEGNTILIIWFTSVLEIVLAFTGCVALTVESEIK